MGILGAGGIVPHHLRAVSLSTKVRVVAIADADVERAEELAREFGVDTATGDPVDVVGDPAVQAVLVALPTFYHCEWIDRCAQAGKHVLTEKPLCRTTAQARQVVRVCEERGVKLAVGYQRRFSPARIMVRQLVRSGALGRPVTWVISDFGSRSDGYRGPKNWMWNLELGGGFVMDGSIHSFDFACWVLGGPAEGFAVSRRISDEASAPTQAAAVIRFEQGDNLSYSAARQEGDFGSGGEPDRIIGPKGTIILDGDFSYTYHDRPGRKHTFEPDSSEPVPDRFIQLFRDQLESFAELITAGRQDFRLASGDEALLSLWIAENIVGAGQEGRHFGPCA